MLYDEIISLENLFTCWNEFKHGKGSRLDVREFDRYLEDNIFALHCDLANHNYRHGAYHTFHIHDPKRRVISKATVRDRLVHHMVFNELYRIFDPTFIYHSYASRLDKGTHLAVQNLSCALRAVSRNYTRNIWTLKCDIKKFFYNVNHHTLLQIIRKKIKDDQFLLLVCEIIKSFPPVDKKVERERERVIR
ncbi:MAG: reverse transcriptase domain-containing protein [Patescibacteria group bacterium]